MRDIRTVPDPRNTRVLRLEIPEDVSNEFVAFCAERPGYNRHAIPAERTRITAKLKKMLGAEAINFINKTLRDPDRGAISMKPFSGEVLNQAVLSAWITGLGYLVGTPRCDEKNDNLAYFDISSDDPINFNPDAVLPLHTDGTYYNGNTDWIICGKVFDTSTVGGESLLLHVNDWADYSRFSSDEWSSREFVFRGPSAQDPRKAKFGNRGDNGALSLPMFYSQDGKNCVRMAFQWVHPRNDEEANRLCEIFDSLLDAQEDASFALDVGEIYLLDNKTWLHGRARYGTHQPVERRIIRSIGAY
ncbi:carbon starvation induced protein CsiD [Rhizobium sp. FKY42]|uniref:carbon starvation induced protein CsiD n=1 Tax=Rhizobium sp. FKY42 TaxID=2562310 RepID=UPI0010C022D0|nr:carbon starvation induced protein CsiD [Rhizobium sp. FKY42]